MFALLWGWGHCLPLFTTTSMFLRTSPDFSCGFSPFSFFPPGIFDVLRADVYAHWRNGRVFAKPRPVSPYTVIERLVDWQRAAAAELLRHGGGYSVTEAQRRSYVSFPSSRVVKGRIKWYGTRGRCVRLKRTPRGSLKRPELPHASKMEKCIAV